MSPTHLPDSPPQLETRPRHGSKGNWCTMHWNQLHIDSRCEDLKYEQLLVSFVFLLKLYHRSYLSNHCSLFWLASFEGVNSQTAQHGRTNSLRYDKRELYSRRNIQGQATPLK